MRSKVYEQDHILHFASYQLIAALCTSAGISTDDVFDALLLKDSHIVDT